MQKLCAGGRCCPFTIHIVMDLTAQPKIQLLQHHIINSNWQQVSMEDYTNKEKIERDFTEVSFSLKQIWEHHETDLVWGFFLISSYSKPVNWLIHFMQNASETIMGWI